MPRELRDSIKIYLEICQPNNVPSQIKSNERVLCNLYSRRLNGKTKSLCAICSKAVCGGHTINGCRDCYNKAPVDSDYEK